MIDTRAAINHLHLFILEPLCNASTSAPLFQRAFCWDLPCSGPPAPGWAAWDRGAQHPSQAQHAQGKPRTIAKKKEKKN